MLLHLNDAPYTQKPPLYFWLAAALGAPFDRVSEVAARLPSAIAGVLSIGLSVWIGRILLANRTAAILAAESSRRAFVSRSPHDVSNSMSCSRSSNSPRSQSSCFSRRSAVESRMRDEPHLPSRSPRQPRRSSAREGAGWLAPTPRLSRVSRLGRAPARAACDHASLGLDALDRPVAIWIACAVSLAPPGFAEVAVEENLVGRFFHGTSHARPFFYYVMQLPLDFLPWSLLLPLPYPFSGTARAACKRTATLLARQLASLSPPRASSSYGRSCP